MRRSDDPAMYNRPKVILVDRDADYIFTAKRYIESLDFEVITALTWEEALDAIYDLSSPAIVLAEYNLSDKTGLALIDEIEKATRFPVECVLVTAQSDHKILALAKHIGCDYFVKEPTTESPVNVGELYMSHIISAEGRLKQRMKWMSKKMDSLTGLYDRESVMESWVQEWKHAKRNNSVTTCIFIDVNDLKPINDMYGHTAGDIVLQEVASCIQQHVRPKDLVVRYGGDEFAIILPETDKTEALDIAERIHGYLKQTLITLDEGIMVHASIATGAAVLEAEKMEEDPVRSLHHLYELADRAMYKNKMLYKARRGGLMKEFLYALRSTWTLFSRVEKI
mgnify:FL=1